MAVPPLLARLEPDLLGPGSNMPEIALIGSAIVALVP